MCFFSLSPALVKSCLVWLAVKIVLPCAVTGLLDGGLGGLLWQVRNLLNQILGTLGISA